MALFIVTLSVFTSHIAYAADVNGVRLWRAPDNTRLVFDLSAPAEHKLVNMPDEGGHEQRIVITLSASSFKGDKKQVNLANTPLADFNTEMQGNDLQLIIDLNAKVKAKSFLLPANNQYGDRLVLDLFDEDAIKETKPLKPASNGMRDIVVAVDPGHGGEDPGAKGPGGLYEKNVTLAIAKELVALINDTPGYSAFLTRSGDYYVSLRGRTQIARKKGTDLFVSIHADAFKDPDAEGAGVFALSQRGATSETARWLAQSENDADLVGGVNLGDKDPMLQEVLLDLSMTATIATSLDMGDKVVAQMKKLTRMHKGFVEQAGFVVLKNPDIPSLLIETGFITNPNESRKLADPKFRSAMAKGIFSGIDAHFRSKPPMDTALAAARGGKVVPKMEKIASKPSNVSTAALAVKDSTLDDEIALEDAGRKATADKAENNKAGEDKRREDKTREDKDELEKLVVEKSTSKKITNRDVANKDVVNKEKITSQKTGKTPEPAVKGKSVSQKSQPSSKPQKSTAYVVKKGDTLSGIAARNKISMSALREFNKLDDPQVRVGQTIRIPVSSQ